MKKKIFSALLAMILSCSFMVGCSGCSTGGKTGGKEVNTAIPGTIHQFDMEETNDYLVKNGLTSYVVLMPNTYDEYLRKAKDEFVYFFKEATNIDIKVEYEDATGKTHNAGNTYISLGQTKLLETADLDIDYFQLEDQGCRILTKDKSIYIVGGSSVGTLYSVYDFFQLTFNYETYYYNTFKIDQDVKNVKLCKYDVIDVPDIAQRWPQWGTIKNTDSRYRFRMALRNVEEIIPIGGDFEHGWRVHTMSEIVWDNREYEQNWISPNSATQLCYTARGDEESYKRLVEHMANSIIEQSLSRYPREEYPYANYVNITNEDTGAYCNCEACIKAAEEDGARTGRVIVLMNDIMEKLREWMNKPENEPYRRDDLKIMFFAYQAFLDAPVVWSEEAGKWVYKNEECRMRDDVAVWYAVNNGFVYLKDISAPESELGRLRMQQWLDITDNVGLWTYPVNYSYTTALCDTYNCFTDEFYRWLVEGGLKFFFNEGAGTMIDTTGFEGLKAFLDYKLMWNASLNSLELTKEWFEGMYADAAPMMYQLFLEEREHSIEFFYSSKKLDTDTITVPYDTIQAWNTTTLFNWMDTCEDALTLVEKKYKLHYPEKYETLKYNIELEYIMPAHMLFKVFGTQIQGVERETLLTTLKDRLSNKKQIGYINGYIAGLSV